MKKHKLMQNIVRQSGQKKCQLGRLAKGSWLNQSDNSI